METDKATAPPRPKRQPRDAYFTPDTIAEAIVFACHDEGLLPDTPGPILEPSVGDGAFARWLSEVYPVVGVDLEPGPNAGRYCNKVIREDFLTIPSGFRVPFAIMNPPFTGMVKHVRKACDVADVVVALLPTNFVHSRKRAGLPAELGLAEVWHLVHRVSFVYPDKSKKGGSAMQDLAVFVFKQAHRGNADGWRGRQFNAREGVFL